MKFLNFFALFAVLMIGGIARAQDRVAVWNPQNGERGGRVQIDLPYLDNVTQWLNAGGVAAERVTSAQMNDEAQFSAEKYAALFMPGDGFPQQNLAALQKFSASGGVLVALNAKIPWNVRLEPAPDGKWTMTPAAPKFAWQSNSLYFGALGMKYVFAPGKHDQGFANSPTAIFKKYLPQAVPINRRLPSFWVVPSEIGDVKTVYYPLVRSTRIDGADVVPQLFIVKSAKGIGIVAVNPFWTRATDEKTWPFARETVVALGKIARDLKSGTLKLAARDAIDLPEDLPPPEPLRNRLATGSIAPENAKVWARWGKFDGTSFELGKILGAGETATFDARASTVEFDRTPFPRALMPGARVSLALPPLGKEAHFLRVRGAYNASGANLKADFGGATVINETFLLENARAAGAPGLIDVPAEFHRVVFLPGEAKNLTLLNAGTAPIYFDALQIESPAAPRLMTIGLGAGYSQTRMGSATALTPELARGWGRLRATSRTQEVGPPNDARRWDKVDALMKGYFSLGVPVELLLEGTPAWAAISPERLPDPLNNRLHSAAPDNAKYAEIAERLVRTYGDRIDSYEIWNEADSQQFFRGTPAEYAAFFKTIAPIVRRLDPTAKIITAGMSSFDENFVEEMVRSGALKQADLFAFHPYAGKSAAWDVAYGQLEGALMARGIGTEIYCNESGFTWTNAEWFTAPPEHTPTTQAALLDKAIARLLANKVARLNVFNAGGDVYAFGIIDENGVPRPAYAIFADYLALHGGTRLDIGMTTPDGTALSGVYVVASQQPNGTISIVVNPADSPTTSPLLLRVPLKQGGNWRAESRVGGETGALEVQVKTAGAQSWAEIRCNVAARTVIALSR